MSDVIKKEIVSRLTNIEGDYLLDLVKYYNEIY